MAKKVIDVSTYQGTINWEKVKTQVDGAIIRCGYGSDYSKQDDNQFARNVSECERLGIPYGVYLYSYADTEAKAKSEAQHILRLIKGKKLSYPVYLDCEEEKDAVRKYAKTACDIIGKIITDAGYQFGVYANLSWWNNYLVGMDKYTKWIAQYNNVCQYEKPYDMWQYSSKGKIDGISGNVDMNECYKDFTVTSAPSTAPTPSPNPSPSTSTFRVLKKGCKGEDVKELQRNLNQVINAGLDVDGSFGSLTEKAVKDFQTKFGIQIDGCFGKESRATMEKALNNSIPTINNKSYSVKVTAKDGLNIRKDPYEKSTKLTAAPYGTILAICDENNGWGKTSYAGRTGWVCLKWTSKN